MRIGIGHRHFPFGVLSFVLQRDSRDALPGWDDLLVGVEPARGSAHAGNPGFVIILWIWYAIVRAF